MGELPVSLEQLDFQNEDGLCILLEQHKAKWYKSCRDKYNNTKYDRLQKHTLTIEADATMTLTADARTSKRIKISSSIEKSTYQCFLCDKPAKLGDLRHASTFGVDSKIRTDALQQNDTHLLAKLSEGDVIALELKYHLNCLVAFYTRATTATKRFFIRKE